MSPTGDPFTDRAVGPAARLVRAVRRDDVDGVGEVLAEVEAGGVNAVRALTVVLAAMVPDDTTVGVLLAWRADPVEYRRLRSCGVSSLTAGARVRMRTERREEIT